ncbi:hypothetical protein NVV94_05685 [Pseudomonas sp. LS1212]|uniref:hypothetical protein n=1 Tax=Pseudomonas sp. LS1212 TaxID=2972478 RepID=UPI00215D0ED3|nr:hypothetical protein [Pseudomonas sp. LS1212]UVJ45073.1 hypothetical protein NVV94_05685 [Pseudomonas sp. LS1212]
MGNEIDLYKPGDLAPYAPSPQPLAPSPDSWSNVPDVLSPGEIDTYQGGQTIFGQTLPPGVTAQQVQAAIGQLAGVFLSDFSKLQHNARHIQQAIQWYQDALANPPSAQRQRHRYNLFEHKSDPIFQAFANFAHDHAFSAKMVEDICWWVSEAARRLNAQPVGSPVSDAQGSAPPSHEDQLSDADWAELNRRNERTKMDTEVVLRKRWGTSYEANIQVIQSYFDGLPARDQAHLTQISNVGVLLNTVQAMEHLFNSAIGSGSLPTSGSAIAQEIAAIERTMKHERQSYLRDPQLQARYRTLLDIRDRS